MPRIYGGMKQGGSALAKNRVRVIDTFHLYFHKKFNNKYYYITCKIVIRLIFRNATSPILNTFILRMHPEKTGDCFCSLGTYHFDLIDQKSG